MTHSPDSTNSFRRRLLPHRPARRALLPPAATHAVRILLLAGIVLLIHFKHRAHLQQLREKTAAAPPLAAVKTLLPTAFRLEPQTDSALRVLDREGQPIGLAMQTSPRADHIVGFSGPTNVLIVLDPDQRIAGMAILSSRDTREHVAQVNQDPRFLKSFVGKSAAALEASRRVDGVSGATLTSLAIAESVRLRLGGESTSRQPSLKFPEPPDQQRIVELFPPAHRLEPSPLHRSLWNVLDSQGNPIGRVLRTAGWADNIIGYQGPTDTLIALDRAGRITRIWVNRSYDNEPYIHYLNDDWSFPKLFEGMTLEELARFDLEQAGIEGVSGATMTSQAVVDGVVAAAQQFCHQPTDVPQPSKPLVSWTLRDGGTAAVVLCGLLIGLTHGRGSRRLRAVYQLVVIGYLGLVNGDLVSQAMLVGWAQSGIPWRTTLGLTLLTAAAVLAPLSTGHNVYCTQICPHGAAQQLLRNRLGVTWHVPRRWQRVLRWLPAALLLWCLLVGMLHLPFSLVDIEPFDAYVVRIAGWATVGVALVGLGASLVVPMAYCRYGCPTGALLEYVRRHARSDRMTLRDLFVVACLLLASVLYLM